MKKAPQRALNPKTKTKKFYLNSSGAFFALSFLIFCSCKPTDFETVRRADQDALNQRSQLAKYLYLQVIKTRNSRDDVRLRALEGLAEVTSNQTFEYLSAVKAIEMAVQEFGQDPQYEYRMVELRKRGAEIYRSNLQNLPQALTLLEPLLTRSDVTSDVLQTAGRIQLSLRQFEEAEKNFSRAWGMALRAKTCANLKTLQLDMIQRFLLEKKCDSAMEWMDKKLIDHCEPKHFEIESERAQCLEMGNEPSKALKILEELVTKDPSNSRAHFLLDALKRRMREKQLN
jgi:tetratricopeptide (TPR) repeat protein